MLATMLMSNAMEVLAGSSNVDRMAVYHASEMVSSAQSDIAKILSFGHGQSVVSLVDSPLASSDLAHRRDRTVRFPGLEGCCQGTDVASGRWGGEYRG